MWSDEGTSIYALASDGIVQSVRAVLSSLQSVLSSTLFWTCVGIVLIFLFLWAAKNFWPIVETSTDKSQAE